MRFLPDGPQIPAALIAAQEKGETIFVCGAGVSRSAGLPLFRGLVEAIYRELGEDWNLHSAEREGMREEAPQYDRVLRCLERRLAASDGPRAGGMRDRIRAAIRKALAPPQDGGLKSHLALLALSRDAESRTRLLTTNFDTLFERAWLRAGGHQLPSHAGPAMPQPRAAGFTGVLHLHGRLEDKELSLAETSLVLTSAEFGDAYLRSGWASRYVYDVVRACTVVLVGYQADDPPMRYLLEALEADRERFPDLQSVYALAPIDDGEENSRARWLAKGVEPILYRTTPDGSHAQLYDMLLEWQRYAEDPTGWRRERLRPILSEAPNRLTPDDVAEVVECLSHGDATQLLGELSPDAPWLPFLLGQNVFRNETSPGAWIASRVNDPAMISACAGLSILDERSHGLIDNSIDKQRAKLSPVRLQAWRLILQSKQTEAKHDFDTAGYPRLKQIKRGELGHAVRREIVAVVQPRLTVSEPWGLSVDEAADDEETLSRLLWIDFSSERYPPPDEILRAWPEALEHEVALLRVAERALLEALDEAADVGFTEGYDRASADVPSIAPHPQNASYRGFYPLTRLIADLVQRIAAKDAASIRAQVASWASSSFALMRRLHLHALTLPNAFSAGEAATALMALDDEMFWVSGAQVELMRLLTIRWAEFSVDDRSSVEARIQQGMPRDLFPPDAFKRDEEWTSIWDSAVFKRLMRITAAGGELSESSRDLIAAISGRNPRWRSSEGDRDDFHVWHEMHSGPDGQPELLSGVSDDRLVQEAMRLQRERHFDQGDVWRLFCHSDPERALRGLRADADAGRWEGDAWRNLLWAANDKGDNAFQYDLADSLLAAPSEKLASFLPAAVSWLQRRHEVLAATDQAVERRFFPLWDKLADIAFAAPDGQQDEAKREGDILTSALNHPGGELALAVQDELVARQPAAGSGIPDEIKPRLRRAVTASGRSGLMARVSVVRNLAYYDWVDPAWTLVHLLPRLAWRDPEASALWQARATGHTGSARLFNQLKPDFLKVFERCDLPRHEWEGLTTQLLQAGIWHRQPEASQFDLSSAEVRRVLTIGPPDVRHIASWQFWRWVGEPSDLAPDATQRWSEHIGPFFKEAWPLDARLRDQATSRNLLLMALECGAAFPDAVDAIADLIVPFELYSLEHTLRLEPQHSDLVRTHPRAFLRLVSALIDPELHPIPRDLGDVLRECIEADPAITSDPNYIRLFGLSRRRGA